MDRDTKRDGVASGNDHMANLNLPANGNGNCAIGWWLTKCEGCYVQGGKVMDRLLADGKEIFYLS